MLFMFANFSNYTYFQHTFNKRSLTNLKHASFLTYLEAGCSRSLETQICYQNGEKAVVFNWIYWQI
jgi:hypothetical protein